MTFTGFVGTACMFPLRAIIAASVALRIHPNVLTAIGVLLGFQLGRTISPLAPVRSLKFVMAALVTLVAAQYLFRR